MRLRRIEILSFIAVLATFVAAVLIYPNMPSHVVSHWGINNNANGYMGKFWGTFLLPIILLVCTTIFVIIPRTDPKKQNIQKFEKYYDLFILTFIFFFTYVYALIIFWNLGYRFVFIQLLSPALALLFYSVSILMIHSEPNYSIGIRTPWTLSSENVWKKTHELGGKLFQVAAFISLFSLVMPDYAIWFILVPVISFALYTVLYSYLEFKKEKTQNNE